MAKEDLDARDFTQQRDQTFIEAVKVILLMNGGAAVALLAFLQTVLASNRDLSRFVISGLSLLVFGIAFAGGPLLLRYSASFSFQSGEIGRWNVLRACYLACAWSSLALFIAGMARWKPAGQTMSDVVLWGAWTTIS